MKKNNNEPILTSGLRTNLKSIMQAEIQKFPELLEQLEAKERINVTVKIMPYLFPKITSVSLSEGEPWRNSLDDF